VNTEDRVTLLVTLLHQGFSKRNVSLERVHERVVKFSFNISENNIISIENANVLWYLISQDNIYAKEPISKRAFVR
jgi:hypothetical protein